MHQKGVFYASQQPASVFFRSKQDTAVDGAQQNFIVRKCRENKPLAHRLSRRRTRANTNVEYRPAYKNYLYKHPSYLLLQLLLSTIDSVSEPFEC